MSPIGKRRLFLVGALVVAAGALSFVAFGNMGENLVYYWNPTELREAGDEAMGPTIRLGGMVQQGSLDWDSEANRLDFVVGDGKSTVPVRATGAPPQMFREGIGVVVEGTMHKDGLFHSDRLMVKHSNEYKVPEEHKDVEEIYRTVETVEEL